MFSNLMQNNYPEIIIRCVAIYLFIIISIRVFGKKELAQLSVIDLVFILLISNSVQNAMIGPDTSLGGGLIAAISLFIINYILKWIFYKNKAASELIQGKAVLLIYKGDVQLSQLEKAEITIEELTAAVREHGVDSVAHVDLAMLEVDGNISVISGDFKHKTMHKSNAHKRKFKLKGKII
jgi:hypothetical protein